MIKSAFLQLRTYRIVTLLFLLLFACTLCAQFQSITNNGAIIITEYTGFGGDVVVPEKINGFPVIAIGDNAFYDRFYFGNLTTVMLPQSVTTIGTNAFGNCSGLTKVTFGAELTVIGDYAFDHCTGLTHIDLPESLTTIRPYAFNTCLSLRYVTIPNSVTTIEEGAFYWCKSLNSITIPGSLTKIANRAFYGCSGLTNVVLLPGLTNVGNSAFHSCTSLTSVTIPESVTEIGASAFYSCENLISLTLGSSLSTIGDLAFAECGLTQVELPSNLLSIGNEAFSCSSLTNINVDTANPVLASQGGVLFNKALTALLLCPEGTTGSYTVLASVVEVRNGAFEGCSSLTDVIIPYGVTNIGNLAFAGCSRMTNVTIPNSVANVGDYAFAWCSSLKAVAIPKSVTRIGDYGFAWSSLDSVLMPSGVTTIGSYAFVGTDLTSVTIPDSIKFIGNHAFVQCYRLTNLVVHLDNPFFASVDGVLFNKTLSTLILCPNGKTQNYAVPDTVTSIGASAFEECSRMTNIIFPKDITSIGDFAFDLCRNLDGLFFKGNAPSVGSNAFRAAQPVAYYLPGTTGWATASLGFSSYLWNVRAESARIATNNFVFTIKGPGWVPISIDVSTNPVTGPWQFLRAFRMNPCQPYNGALDFSDPVPTNVTARFYRIRSP